VLQSAADSKSDKSCCAQLRIGRTAQVKKISKSFWPACISTLQTCHKERVFFSGFSVPWYLTPSHTGTGYAQVSSTTILHYFTEIFKEKYSFASR
jgi:hypothetical protein